MAIILSYQYKWQCMVISYNDNNGNIWQSSYLILSIKMIIYGYTENNGNIW